MSPLKKLLEFSFRTILFLFLAASLSGCLQSISGTGTGNPMSDGQPASDSNRGDQDGKFGDLPSEKILIGLCELLSSCHNELHYNGCTLTLYSGADLVESLDLPQERFASYQEVVEADDVGRLSIDQGAQQNCHLALSETLTCEDVEVVRAYDPNRENPFAELSQLLSIETFQCQKVLRIKE